jgi:hypothetical protein
MSILRLLKRNTEGNSTFSSETETVRKIVQSLDQLEPERAKFIAAFAYLLSRAARADLHISLEETGRYGNSVGEDAEYTFWGN